jgi:hypothetical protein
MLTQGQLVFAGLFCLVFIGIIIYVYRKDLVIHKIHYKGVMKVLFVFLLFIVFLFFVKYFMKS